MDNLENINLIIGVVDSFCEQQFTLEQVICVCKIISTNYNKNINEDLIRTIVAELCFNGMLIQEPLDEKIIGYKNAAYYISRS